MQGYCKDCAFWHGEGPEKEQGLCRRYAPRPMQGQAITTAAGEQTYDRYLAIFPTTFAEDWCGEFEPQE